jgi:hypothetical protein
MGFASAFARGGDLLARAHNGNLSMGTVAGVLHLLPEGAVSGSEISANSA